MPKPAALAGAILLAVASAAAAAEPRHWVFFGYERERVAERSFLDQPLLEGAQLKFSWRELEPERDRYDFAAVETALAALAAHGKRLWIQLQDVSFDPERLPVPDYLRAPELGGGADLQYPHETPDDAAAVAGGWVARRWDPAVRARFAALLAELGRRFDGRIEGINLPESAVDFEEAGRFHPPGFTFAGYRDGLLENLAAARRAFPRSIVMQYLNFMPGEWLPWEDRGLQRSVLEFARSHGIGLGGPDLLPHRRGQMQNGYRFLAAARGELPTGIAFQDGNAAAIDPALGRPPGVAELVAFARDELGVTRIFWGTEEPFYSAQLLPWLASRGATAPSVP